jgi:hypothetical protein
MNNKKLVSIIGILIIISVGGIFMMKKGSQTVSPDILSITSPVFSVSGTVEKVNGGIISIVVNQNTLPPMTQPIPPVNPPGAVVTISPTSVPKKLTYTVKISDKVMITRPPLMIPLLLATPKPPDMQKLSIKDINIGENVSIQSSTDLRLLSGNTFEAVSVSMIALSNSINGKITSVESDKIKVKTSMLGEKEYTVTISNETEISRYLPMDKDNPMPKPEKLSLSDLKKDMQVTVYTNVDVTKEQNVTALRIDPMMTLPVVEPVVPSPISASPVTTISPSSPPLTISP